MYPDIMAGGPTVWIVMFNLLLITLKQSNKHIRSDPYKN